MIDFDKYCGAQNVGIAFDNYCGAQTVVIDVDECKRLAIRRAIRQALGRANRRDRRQQAEGMSYPTRSSTTIAACKPMGYLLTSGNDERSDALFDEHCGGQIVVIAFDKYCGA